MPNVKQTRIFLSYAQKDIDLVDELYSRLKQAGFSPWQDSKDILPGELWKDALIRAIREAPFFLACLSNNSVNKRGVIQEEIKEALQMWRQKLDDDIYLIPLRLEECQVPDALAKFQWVDLFEDGGFEKLAKALREGIKKLGLVIRPLRSKPVKNLSEDDVKKMLRDLDFYDDKANWMGKGLQHLYEPKDKVIIDHTTGLMWQQGGSSDRLTYYKALEYIRQLNQDKLAGFSDWRLPTLEEAMSLMEAKKNENNGFYINSLFGIIQNRIWTIDQQSRYFAWVPNFALGSCNPQDRLISIGAPSVRAVRYNIQQNVLRCLIYVRPLHRLHCSVRQFHRWLLPYLYYPFS
ncbi:MAG: hypothetical protein CV087_23430 [Candidatus Brocadia sp. WS118]|nr:MAG: hypothetical protein CV087_23430 [Candidatus Brocadia sp. WS118]